MEIANSKVLHANETKALCSSFISAETKMKDTINENEDELLYGNNEDAEDEDALSDDSMRLRVSDDEVEEQYSPVTNTNNARDGAQIKNTEMGSEVRSADCSFTGKDKNYENGENTLTGDLKSVVDDAKDDEEGYNSLKKTTTNSDNCDERKDNHVNGDIDEITSKGASHATKKASPNRLDDRSNRDNSRNYSVPNFFPSNPCSEKYYNQNSHYGRRNLRTHGLLQPIFSKTESDEKRSKEKISSLASAQSGQMSISRSKKDCESDKDTPSTKSNLSTNEAVANVNDIDESVKSLPNESVETSESSVDNNDDEINIANEVSDHCSNICDPTSNPNHGNKTLVTKINQDVASVVSDGADEVPGNISKSMEKIDTEAVTTEVSGIVNDNSIVGDLPAANETNNTAEITVVDENREKEERERRKNSSGEGKMVESKAPEDSSDCKKIVESNNCDKTKSEMDEIFEKRKDKGLEEIEISSMNDETIESRKSIDESDNPIQSESEEKGLPLKEHPLNDQEAERGLKIRNDDNQRSEKIDNEAEIVDIDDEPTKKSMTHNDGKTPNDPPKTDLNDEFGKNSTEVGTDGTNETEIKTENSESNALTSECLELSNNKFEVKLPDACLSFVVTIEKSEDDSAAEKRVDEAASVAKVTVETIDEKNNCAKVVDAAPLTITSESKASVTVERKSVFSDNAEDNNVYGEKSESDNIMKTSFHGSVKRTASELMLDEMELSKRIRIGRKTNCEANEVEDEAAVAMNSDKSESVDLQSEESTFSNTEKLSSPKGSEEKNDRSESTDADDSKRTDDCEVIEVSVKRKHRRSRKSLNILRKHATQHEQPEGSESTRQKRKTAMSAEEIIRKEYSGNADSDSNDSLSKFITFNCKPNDNLRAASPPTLKRNYDDEDESDGAVSKKPKSDTTETTNNTNVSLINILDLPPKKETLRYVRNFFQRNANGTLRNIKQEELEELLIQKVAESITMRDEIGKLREQAKISERNQEATRVKFQQLAKQIKDFEMVLNRYKADLRMATDSKAAVPIKINRSVGLQVNFLTDSGIQNLRQLPPVPKSAPSLANGPSTSTAQQQTEQSTSNVAFSPKPASKTRSPKRSETTATTPVVTSVSTLANNSPHVPNVTPAALVVSKTVTDCRTSTTPVIQQTTGTHPHIISSNAIVVNGNITTSSIRPSPTVQISKAKSNDLIDLTQEEDKTKAPGATQSTALTTRLNDTSPTISNVPKIAPRYHTVIQTMPTNVTLTTQGLRVAQPANQPTPTALVNNMNAPRLAYVTMQGGIVPRGVVITSTTTPIRPTLATTTRNTFPANATIANNNLRVLPASGIPPSLVYKHPAALPESHNPPTNPSWKLAPPAPSLKINKQGNGIVLSWNMALTDKFADIASYQLYAYQEMPGVPPSPTSWKKVGDVRALPLPMACTLTQFSEGNVYYFAVRAVDKHSRLGQYSTPGNIAL